MQRLLFRTWEKALLLPLLVAAGLVSAAAPDIGTTLDSLRPSREAPRIAPEGALPQAPRPAQPLDSPIKVGVRGFRVTGVTVFPDAELQGVLQSFVGRDLSFGELNQAAGLITDYYRARGYSLAYAYLPLQAIANGVVEIVVLEGRIGKIQINLSPDAPVTEVRVLDYVASLQSGVIVEQRLLERALLLLNDLPGVVVQSTLRPGDSVGETDLVLDVTAGQMAQGTLEGDNWGGRFSGENRLSASLTLNSATRMNERILFRTVYSEEGATQLNTLTYLVPLNSIGTKLSLTYSKVDYNLINDFAALQSHGSGLVSSVQVLHPFVRSRDLNLYGSLTGDDKRLHDRNDSVGTVDDRRIRLFGVGLSGDLRDSVAGGGVTSFSVASTSGRHTLETPAVALIDASPAGLHTAGAFRKISFDVRRIQALTPATSLYFSLLGQEASRNLPSAERVGFGGPNAVRAYPGGEASSDSGYVASAELRLALPRIDFLGGDASLSAFYDWSRSTVNTNARPIDTQNRRGLSGYGLGLNIGRANDFVVKAIVAWRGDDKQPVADPVNRTPRVWLNAIKYF